METATGLNISISLQAAPAVHFGTASSNPSGNEDISIRVAAKLSYERLEQLLSDALQHKRFNISEGLIDTYIIINAVTISSDVAGYLLINVGFGGTFSGTVYFKGKPVYNADTATLSFESIDYQLDTKSLLLLAGRALFQKKITRLLQQHTAIVLSPVYQQIQSAAQPVLNKEWSGGVTTQGAIDEVRITEVAALPNELLIEAIGIGRLQITISNLPF